MYADTFKRTLYGILAGFLFLTASAAATTKSENRLKIKSSYQDIKFEIENAIINKGFVIDFNGNIAKMLENTANTVDNPKTVFKNAEFWQFCSSKITRRLVEQNPANLTFCPFVIYAFETTADPGIVSIGFRPLHTTGIGYNKRIVEEVNNLLHSIVFEVN